MSAWQFAMVNHGADLCNQTRYSDKEFYFRMRNPEMQWGRACGSRELRTGRHLHRTRAVAPRAGPSRAAELDDRNVDGSPRAILDVFLRVAIANFYIVGAQHGRVGLVASSDNKTLDLVMCVGVVGFEAHSLLVGGHVVQQRVGRERVLLLLVTAFAHFEDL